MKREQSWVASEWVRRIAEGSGISTKLFDLHE